MFQFVYWLKAIAAILITNSHYGDIWPSSAMTVGGHLGNCLYFLISGFCLCHIKDSFPKWYAKRIIRIYPALWLCIGVNLIVGFFNIGSFSGFVHCFFYPTWYHFIASILLLYILFYVVLFLQKKTGIKTYWILVVSLVFFLAVYLLVFDASYYHIDDVEENWVRFMFWGAMLAGVWLRERYDHICVKISAVNWLCFGVLFVFCLGFKLILRKYPQVSVVQCIMPMSWVLLTSCIALIAIKLEIQGFFKKTPGLNKIMRFVAAITLEIYLGQNVIIHNLAFLGFPLNFVVVTVLIVVYAWCAHYVASWIQKKAGKVLRIE